MHLDKLGVEDTRQTLDAFSLAIALAVMRNIVRLGDRFGRGTLHHTVRRLGIEENAECGAACYGYAKGEFERRPNNDVRLPRSFVNLDCTCN